jgi:hypothetical protein
VKHIFYEFIFFTQPYGKASEYSKALDKIDFEERHNFNQIFYGVTVTKKWIGAFEFYCTNCLLVFVF